MSEREICASDASDACGPAGSPWQDVARDAAKGFQSLGMAETAGETLRELLVFGLDGHAYAVDVGQVREIVRMKRLTRVPRAPAWLLGVVALRGEIVEVVDLRVRLGLGAAIPGPASRIIVLHGQSDRVAGLLVDRVSEVYRASEADRLPAPTGEARAVAEVIRHSEGFVSILDVERALGVGDA